MHKHKPTSAIDYLGHSERLIGRPGYTLNIVTGCRHHETGVCKVADCYARRMVERGFLKGHPSYPYGFAPTFHPERVKAIGGKPKLIFLNDMGDVGGDWDWSIDPLNELGWTSPCFHSHLPNHILNFANLNPHHIILLLTKNPSWYALAEWPDNVWCGFTATNNDELEDRWSDLIEAEANLRWWASCEPWLDDNAPNIRAKTGWLVIGGLTGKVRQPVSATTLTWLGQPFNGKRFVKDNAYCVPPVASVIREYPDEWRLDDA